jgi:hypothetical protein
MALGRPAQGSVKQPIVMDAKHMHFGGGQTETMLTLLTGHVRRDHVDGEWNMSRHACSARR